MAKSHKIKGIIKSTQKTAVITKAMQVVSASKLPNALSRYNHAKPYADLAHRIIQHYTELGSHPYFSQKQSIKSVGILLISTDRGLCGSLNLQLFKKTLSEIIALKEQGIDVKLSIIGQKGLAFFGKKHPVLSSAERLGDKPELKDLMQVIQPMLSAYDKGEIGSILIASNQFVNTLTQKAELVPLLPLTLPEKTVKYAPDYHYESPQEEVVTKLISDYTESIIYRAVIENIACEQAARMMAMKSATDNANDIIEDLNLTYNKIRQALITQEIAEISAGANQSEGENL